MINTILFLVALVLCIIGFEIFVKWNKRECEFMSFSHADIYRGVAVLIIMISHVAGSYGTRLFTPLGGTGVAIFLISSGYGLNESYKKNSIEGSFNYSKKYWKSKSLKVFVPYAVFVTIVAVFSGDYNIIEYLLDIICLKPSYWYLGILLFSYLVFYIITISNKIYKYKYLILFLSSIAVFFIIPSDLWVEQAIAFAFGVYISDYKEKIENLFSKLYIQLSLLILGLTLLGLKQVPIIRALDGTCVWDLIQLTMKMSFALIIIIVTWTFYRYLNFKFFIFTGSMSLEVYLVHSKCLAILNTYISPVLQVVAFMILTFIVSWLFKFLIIKIDTNQLGFTRSRHSS